MPKVKAVELKCPVCGKTIVDIGVAANLRHHLNKAHRRKCTMRMVDLAVKHLPDVSPAGTALSHYHKT